MKVRNGTLIAAAAAGITVAAAGFASAQELKQGQERQAPAAHRMENGKGAAGAEGQMTPGKEQAGSAQAQAQTGEPAQEQKRAGAAESAKPGMQGERPQVEQKGAEPRNQAQSEKPSPTQEKTGQAAQRGEMQKNAETGKAAEQRAGEQRPGEAQKGAAAEQKNGQPANAMNRNAATQNGATAEREKPRAGAAAGAEKQTNAGAGNAMQPNAGAVHATGNAHISNDQAARISQTLMASGGRENVNITNVSVGAAVPGDVTLMPLPASVVDLVPEYRGYDYVVAHDEIVIVEPSTRHIVEVIGGGGATEAMATTRVNPCSP